MRAMDLPPITGHAPSSFAHGVICQRHPAIIEQIVSDTPCTSPQVEKLRRLADESRSGVIEGLETSEPDRDYWTRSAQGFIGKRWTDVPFLWAEAFFYRRLLESIDYFGDGPWRGLDPFQPMKERELMGPAVAAFLDETRSIFEMNDRQQFEVLIRSALLGNRADLGFRMGASGGSAAAAGIELLIDETDRVWSHLSSGRPIRAMLIADNAGPEVIADLLLCDLLITKLGCRVRIDVKPLPHYVSDATAADVMAALRLLARSGPWLHAVHDRLMDSLRRDLLTLRTHSFYCRPECYFDAPPDLVADLRRSDLVLLKGDLNYRRLVGDVMWDATTPFADAVAYFPTSVVALRTLKCDVMVGLDAAALAALDRTGASWRTDGSRGVVQSRLNTPR
jgi:hypothetical protein